ncbi:MAG TPA: SCO6880 family protein [Acidimicrobiales bacterium]|nr:SCO6880 family protein [Acidimicrobiales bacterium]
MSEAPPTRYRFGPLERRGLVAGWRGGQIGAVALALVIGVGVLRMSPSAVGVVVALASLAIGVGVATWPIAGRTAEEWAPDALRHALTLGRRPRGGPGPFAGVRLIRVDPSTPRSEPQVRCGSGGIGVFHDRSLRTFTAVLGASDPGFVLLGEDDKARRIGAWAGVLASLAREGSAVHRVQWVERVVPADVVSVPGPVDVDVDVDVDADAGASARTGVAAARVSYAALVEAQSPTSLRHEVLLAVTIHAGRSARAVKSAGGGDAGACTVLVREVAALRRRVTDASIDVGAVLSPQALTVVVRDAYDARGAPDLSTCGRDGTSARPLRRPHSPRHSSMESGRSGHELGPWPMGVEVHWGRLRADGTWHSTYWVAEWPRTDAGPDFLGPLLLCAEIRRTMSVVMEPLGPIEASRKAAQARTADIADSELRRRGGFLATARRRKEEEILARREIELADGHAQYRFSGYVTVSAPDPDALEEACGRVEQAAGQAGLELRRCYGDQADTFMCTLPLGRGLA